MKKDFLTDAPILVVGAGIMGLGIAQVAAQAGHQVMIYDSRAGAAVVDHHLVARLGCHLRDAKAHDASTHHQDRCVGQEIFFHWGIQLAGRLVKNAAKPSRASSLARTRLMVWTLSSRNSALIGAGASCAKKSFIARWALGPPVSSSSTVAATTESSASTLTT